MHQVFKSVGTPVLPHFFSNCGFPRSASTRDFTQSREGMYGSQCVMEYESDFDCVLISNSTSKTFPSLRQPKQVCGGTAVLRTNIEVQI